MTTASIILFWLHNRLHETAMMSPSSSTIFWEKILSFLILTGLILTGIVVDVLLFYIGAYATFSQVLCGFQLAFGGTFILESALVGVGNGHFNCPRPTPESSIDWGHTLYIAGVGAAVYFVSTIVGALRVWQTFGRD